MLIINIPLYLLEYIDNLDAKVTIKSADLEGLIEENASVAGFKVGEKVTYRDLLYGLLLPSGADAALALVHNTYKSEDAFIAKMNELKDEGDGFEEDRDAYAEKNVFFVPPSARWDFIKKSAKLPTWVKWVEGGYEFRCSNKRIRETEGSYEVYGLCF